MTNDFRTVSLGIVRLIMTTFVEPRMNDHMARIMVASGVVLMPPPVEPCDAPMNIRIAMKNSVESLREAISTVIKPAVQVVTA